jgi:hypothetical protein
MGDDYEVERWWDDGVERAVDEFVEDRSLNCQVYGSQFIIEKPDAA